MAALGGLAPWRHLVVGGAVGAVSLASLVGVVGEDHNEIFDAKQIVVTPSGDDGLRIREVVDIDFGDQQRHGYERIIPNDFGVPAEVTAQSDDAPDDVSVQADGVETVIRVGDPDITVTGPNRYVLEYTYPATTLDTGVLDLDIIGIEETLATVRFEVVVAGFELADIQCNVGESLEVRGGCELVADGDVYRAVIEPLEPGQGLSIEARVTGRRDIAEVAPPARPEPNVNRRVPLAAGTAVIGLASAGGLYALLRRRGRNEVFSGGAADAAFGVTAFTPTTSSAMPPPSPPRDPAPPGGPAPLGPPDASPAVTPDARNRPGTHLVADSQMDELATIEFVPPKGIEPWLGNVLLGEAVTNDSVAAWISSAAAKDYLTISKDDDDVVVAPGPELDQAPPDQRAIIDTMFDGGNKESITLGKYAKSFAKAWAAIRNQERQLVDNSGLWKRRLTNQYALMAVVGIGAILVMVVLGIVAWRGPARAAGVLDPIVLALALAVVVPATVAYLLYASLLPARSAEGSALALRTESFRRFLQASEGQHVEWAWKHGLLREYSAWAVALGAASAWENAMKHASVPPTELTSGPMIVYLGANSFNQTHTAPSSSGGGGGGGFSGGGVGGGGGGGSSGSW